MGDSKINIAKHTYKTKSSIFHYIFGKNIINMPKTRRHISTKKTENKSSDHTQKKKSTRLKSYQNVICSQDDSNQSEPKSNVRSSKVNTKRNSRVEKQIIRREEEKNTIERILDKRKDNGEELEYF